MDHRPLHILMAFVLALQTSLVGMAVCSDGGCCHVDEAVMLHIDADESEHHDHSTIVSPDDSHSCTCTDQEIAADDAIAGFRDELTVTGPVLFAASVLPTVEPRDWPRIALCTPPWQRRGDPAALHRLAIVRTTRLLV